MPLINYIGNRQEALGNGAGGFVRGAAPPPPSLTLDYLIVGGGDAVYLTGYGGGGGGVVSGSAVTMSFNTTLNIEVGAGGTSTQGDFGKQSSISSSLFGYLIASGAIEGQSGLPQGKSAGLGGPYPIGNGGGAGAGENGIDGVQNLSGRGGYGLQWVNGIYYAGGGGGSTNGPVVAAGAGTADIERGGGGNGAGYPFGTGSFGVNGLGGGGGGVDLVGGGGQSSSAGGSGVVIVRYTTGSLRMADGGYQYESGGYFYHEFTGSGTLFYGYQ